MYVAHKEKYKGLDIEIIQDIAPENPITDFEGLVTFACFHRKYDLSNTKDFDSPEEVREYIKETKAIYCNLYLLDHSGLSISTGAFGCSWDSGQVGYAFIEREKILKEFGNKNLSPKLKKLAKEIIEGATMDFDAYLTGNVYGFKVSDKSGNEIESCWGFFGDYDSKYGCLIEAKEVCDYTVKAELKKHLDRLKVQIKNRVPLLKRVACPIIAVQTA